MWIFVPRELPCWATVCFPGRNLGMGVLVLQSDPRLSGISGLQVKAPGLGKVFLGAFS